MNHIRNHATNVALCGATSLDGEKRDSFGTVVASTGDLHIP